VNSVVIVDDEPPARRKLGRLLEPHGDFRVVGEAGSAGAAVAVIEETRPAVVFLDVQMPDGTGFTVLERLAPEVTPLTIFVTAFEQYAVEAFGVRALDYLLKPVSAGRFDAALARVRESLQLNAKYRRRFLVREEMLTYFVEVGAVEWLESARNYVVLHAGGRAHIVRATLEGVLGQLDPAQFARISRSAAVNVSAVQALGGDWVLLKSGERLKAAPRHVSGLKSAHWV
jgi:two-component system LytT family response regulator